MDNQFKFSNRGSEPDSDDTSIFGQFMLGPGAVHVTLVCPATSSSATYEQSYDESDANDHESIISDRGDVELRAVATAMRRAMCDGDTTDIEDVTADDGVVESIMIAAAELLGVEYDGTQPVSVWSPASGWRDTRSASTTGWKKVAAPHTKKLH